jgi:hypothetical protein
LSWGACRHRASRSLGVIGLQSHYSSAFPVWASRLSTFCLSAEPRMSFLSVLYASGAETFLLLPRSSRALACGSAQRAGHPRRGTVRTSPPSVDPRSAGHPQRLPGRSRFVASGKASSALYSARREVIHFCRVGIAHRREPPRPKTVGDAHPTMAHSTPRRV